MTAVFLATTFLAATVYCCCFSSIQWSKQKHACCEKKSGHDQQSSKHDCPHCNSSFNADTIIKDIQQVHLITSVQTIDFEHKVSHVPIVLGKSLFINGPPGFFNTVPLYLQTHALRI